MKPTHVSLELSWMKVLNGIKLILDDHGNNLDTFRIILCRILQVLQRSPTPQTSTSSGTIFAVSYNKPALRVYCPNIYTVSHKVKPRLIRDPASCAKEKVFH